MNISITFSGNSVAELEANLHEYLKTRTVAAPAEASKSDAAPANDNKQAADEPTEDKPRRGRKAKDEAPPADDKKDEITIEQLREKAALVPAAQEEAAFALMDKFGVEKLSQLMAKSNDARQEFLDGIDAILNSGSKRRALDD
jgi:hypothetical protein